MKNILDKINRADEIQANKVELGTHEVELALVDDLKKEFSALTTMGGNKADEISRIAQSLLAGKNVAIQLVDKAKKAFEMAKELGIDSKDFDFYVKQADSYAKTLDVAAKHIIKYNADL